eukprot:gene57606-biopygen47454
MDTRVQNPAPQALWLALQEAGLTQRVRFVTHPPAREGVKASTIDHVWAPRGVAVQCKRVKGDLLDGASDHHAIEATFAGPKQKERTQSRWTRKWDRVDTDAMQAILASHGISQETDPSKTEPRLGSLLAKWHAAWNQIKADLAPRKLVIIHKGKRNKRLGASARAAVQRRSKARRAYLRSRTPEDKELFKEAKQAARNAIRDAKATMIKKESEEAGKDAKARWKLRKELAGQARSVPPQPAATAEETNEFFIAKPRRVRQSTLYAPLATVHPTTTETLCQFKPVSTGEVLAALRKARTTWSTGVDDVPMAILKRVASTVAPFVARLINAIIREQEWPRCWKTAKVRALWKRKGSRREVKTYRPIALLPAVSRVAEKVIATQLMQQVQLTHALPMWQHGFRPKHGCHTAVMHLVSSITTILERGEDCVVAAMDLSAAFDTVDHDLLLRKLQDRVGIKGPALQLFSSYLKGRQQSVHMRDKRSPLLDIQTGVPQGSVLGPILFSLNVSDLKENFPQIDIIQYADDCTLVIPVKAGEDRDSLVRRWVRRFVDYCAANRIAAEPEKTQLLHIKAKPPPRNTFAYLKDRLPGRWYARSEDLEIPAMSVSKELNVQFDDGDVYRITEGPNGECQMQGWTVSTVKGRHLYWRKEGSVIRWTRYVYQPTPQEESEHSTDESDSEESLPRAQDQQQPACTIGGQEIPYKEHVK